jgi:integrase
MAKKLTALKVEQAKSRSIRTEMPDGGCAGLYLVIQPNGKRSWAIRYRRKADGKPRKITLSGSLSLAAARAKSTDLLEQAAKGADPAATIQIEKQAARARAVGEDDTFGVVVRKFILRDQRPKNRTWSETARLLGVRLGSDGKLEAIRGGLADRWGGRKFKEIQKRDVLEELDAIVDRGAEIMANRTLAAIRRLGNWAMTRDIISVSPCANVEPPADETKRDRILTDKEIRQLWKACDTIGQPFGPAIKLLLLTGQRRGEVGEMTEGEIDRAKRLWTIPARRAKNDVIHDVPLSDEAIAVLDGVKRIKSEEGFIFTTTGDAPVSGWSRIKTELDRLMESTGSRWTLHDIRRTVATGMQRIGIRMEVAEKVLNHTSGSFGGIVGVYQRHDFAKEKRAALDVWAREVERLVGGQTATEIQMSGR